MDREWSLLHLSDLHLGDMEGKSPEFADDDKEKTFAAYRATALGRLKLILKCKELAGPDMIAVTGDVTNRGSPNGFKRFEDELAPALNECLSGRKALFIVPGNHDVKWNLQPGHNEFTEKFRDFKATTDKIGASTCLFPTGASASGELEFGKSRALVVDHERQLLVLCINSAIRCGEVNTGRREALIGPLKRAEQELLKIEPVLAPLKDDEAPAAAFKLDRIVKGMKDEVTRQTVFDIAQVTESQMISLVSELSSVRQQTDKWDEYLRICLLHHHIVPYSGQVAEHKAFEPVVDAATLLDLLTRFNFHLVLTGHKHHPYVVKHLGPRGELLVCGGFTVAGLPAHGQKQGLRHFHIKRNGNEHTVGIADIPLDVAISDEPANLLQHRHFYIVMNGTSRTTASKSAAHGLSALGNALEASRIAAENAKPQELTLNPLMAEVSRTVERLKRLHALPQDQADVLELLEAVARAFEWDNGGITQNLIDETTKSHLSTAIAIHAVDVLGPAGWVNPVTFRYLSPQLRQYIHKNVVGDSWDLAVSTQLEGAIRKALNAALAYFQESFTPFDNPEDFKWSCSGRRLEYSRTLLWTREELLSSVGASVVAIHSAFNVPLFFLETSPLDRARDIDFIVFEHPGGRVTGYFGRRPRYDSEPIVHRAIAGLQAPPLDQYWNVLADPKLMFARDAREVFDIQRRERKSGAVAKG